MLSHFRAVCAAIVAAATLIIAANTGPARAAEPHHAGPMSQETSQELGQAQGRPG
ncbi:hypothetical protein [Streptomyces sp. SID12501]|uniref:Uncharacterized protein n=1 Tax=Streptomyces sp. SID12501 TaxID=2706042 RepID=A0A6B3BE27_9ACTN|nr:hypothetical protein [Streptomyces sp. SID12501]NEC84697.1 hypothetical protein [Streptomyces sp. SID12501]